MAVCISKTTILGAVTASSEDLNHCSLKKWIQNNVLKQFFNLLEVALQTYVPDTHTPPKLPKNKAHQHEIPQSISNQDSMSIVKTFG